MPPSAASKRFRSATAAVQGRGVASKAEKVKTASLTSLVPDVLQAAGPRMSVAAKRNIFMHARAYLHGQSRTKDANERKILVQSVIEGTRLHQKQGETVTTMHEHMVEQQEERRRQTELQEAVLAAAAAAEQKPPEAEEEYHAANSTLTSVGLLHSQVAKLEALANSYQEKSLVMTAVSSAQKCVGLLAQLRSSVQDDEEMLKCIREAQVTGAMSASLIKDLEGELALMREALLSAKAENSSTASTEEALKLVGAIYEDMLRLPLSIAAEKRRSAPGDAERSASMDSRSLEAPAATVESLEPAPLEPAPLEPAPLEPVELVELEAASLDAVEQAEEEEEVEEEEQAETVEVEVVEDKVRGPYEVPERPVSPSQVPEQPAAAAATAIVVEATSTPAAPTAPVADRASRRPRLPTLETAASRPELEELTPQAADVKDVEASALPHIVEAAMASEVVKNEPIMEAMVVPPAPVAPTEKLEVKKVRRRLVMAPDIRLPALPSRNRKNTADLDWNMEHLNADELDLLNEVITEDGSRSAPSIVCDPKKERLWKQFWGLQDSPRVQAAAAAAAVLAPQHRAPRPMPRGPPVPETEEEKRPCKVRTLPELSAAEQSSGKALIVRMAG